VGGLVSGSLALLTDALHNFSDVLALVISWVATRLSRKSGTPKQTFGFKRSEILAALINGATLIFIAAFLIKEAIVRFNNPEPIDSTIVILLAGLSIVLNGVSVLLLSRDSKESLNIRSAYLHLFTDMLTSVAVLVGGFLVRYTSWIWVDAAMSIGIALYLMISSSKLVFSTLSILLQFAPKDLDFDEVCSSIEKDEQIDNVHHVHLWQLDDKSIHLEAHLEIDQDIRLSEAEKIHDRVILMLSKEFSINHVTLQMERDWCADQDRIAHQQESDH
jgi:cobalt-zinc-cadmium efflux system protein